MLVLEIVLALLAFAGHAAIWIVLVAQVHATVLPRWLIHGFNKIALGAGALLPAAWLWWLAGHNYPRLVDGAWGRFPTPALLYFSFCVLVALGPLNLWLWRRLRRNEPTILLRTKSTQMDVAEKLGYRPIGGGRRRFWIYLPRNEVFQLDINEKHLQLPRLSDALAGLTIAHLSDLHFEGTVDKPYFQEVVRQTNALEPDLIAVTGDLVDKARYIDWIPDTLGELRARYGTYVILGNHDLRVKQQLNRLRRVIEESGLVYLGGRWQGLEIDGQRILLAGNELPWIPPAADLRHVPSAEGDNPPLRILLAHSPDQIGWARVHDFDLMLAGHNHGGQVQLPLLGPIIAPSRTVVKYAGGTYHAPPTVLHVSRGLSALQPLRWGCPPEVTRLVLCSPSSSSTGVEEQPGQPALAT